MLEPHYQANGAMGIVVGNTVDDHFFRRYRELLDDEDHAFDELEHAYEDGDRAHFDCDFTAWTEALRRRVLYLERRGFSPPVAAI